MIPLSVVFLGNTLAFMFLLEEKYNFTFTVLSNLFCFFISFVPAAVLGKAFDTPFLASATAVIANLLVLYMASLFSSRNNFLQKLFLAVLCFANYTFSRFAAEFIFGAVPAKISNTTSLIQPVLFFILFSLVIGLCFYRYFHAFSGRNASLFVAGLLFFPVLATAFIMGAFDFIFRAQIWTGRLLMASLFYLLCIFIVRSVYYAAKFKENETRDQNYYALLDSEFRRTTAAVTSIREAESLRKNYNHLFHTISKMITNGQALDVPDFIDSRRDEFAHTTLLNQYEENPYLNAVIACHAAFAEQSGILFESQAILSPACRMKVPEVCLLADEILQTSLQKAAESLDEKKISFTLSCSDEHLIVETVFSASPSVVKNKQKQAFVWNKDIVGKQLKELPNEIKAFYEKHFKGKKLADFTSLLTTEPVRDENVQLLENAERIISRYSGKYTLNAADNVMIIRVVIDY